MGLRGLDVRISDESLRLWLLRELGQKPARKRRTRLNPYIAVPDATAPAVPSRPDVASSPAASAADTPAAVSPKALSPGNTPLKVATSLIRAGETPVEAFARRNREREAEEAAAKATGTDTSAPRLARDVS
jgi:CCR4-NOT transcriptional regulation complex NOT5 subunit